MGAWEEERKANERAISVNREARGEEKGAHAGAEIKKREQAGGKNSRFGICVSEAVQRWR